MELYVSGSRGAFPVSGDSYREFGQATTCYILKRGTHAVIVDCGSGLLHAKELLGDCTRIDIFLTHLHYDHLLGLLAGEIFPPQAKICFFLQSDPCYGSEAIARFLAPPFWPYQPEIGEIRCVDPPEVISLPGGISADLILACHPNGGMLIRLEAEGKRICFAFDHEHGSIRLDDWVSGCDWLIYDGMYDAEQYATHTGWGHSTWQEGCRLAAENGVGRLLITHHAPESTDAVLRQSEQHAAALFKNVHFAPDGECFFV